MIKRLMFFLALCACISTAQQTTEVSVIDAAGMEELYAANEQFSLLDVQSMEEHVDYGFPPKSMCIPLRLQDPVTREWRDNPEFLAQVEKRLTREEKIVVLCTTGERARRAAELMAEAGFQQVYVFRHGIHGEEVDGEFKPGWIDSELPFVRGVLN